jgi:hypothetical protein
MKIFHVLSENTFNFFYRSVMQIERHQTVPLCVQHEDRRRQHSFMVEVKVKFALEQAMKAQKRSRGVALLFL